MEKARNWVVICYPEHFSSKEEMVKKFEGLFLPTAISPLHPPDEDNSKEHYHIMFCLSGDKSNVSLLGMLDKANLLPTLAGYSRNNVNFHQVQKVGDKSAMLRYFCHLNQPDKIRLNWEDMVFLNGLDGNQALKPTYSQGINYCTEIIEYCRTNKLYYFCDLVDIAIREYPDTWYIYLMEHGAFVKEYLRSTASKIIAIQNISKMNG